MRGGTVVLFSVGVLGCATQEPVGARSYARGLRPYSPASSLRADARDDVPPGLPAVPEAERESIVADARGLVGQHTVTLDGKTYGDDCTSLVRAVFAHHHVDVFQEARGETSGVAALYRFAQSHGRIFRGGHALPGDLVFFHDTYDQNHDGRMDDALTHVGIVESIGPDETVFVVHRVRRGVVRYRMNLAHPGLRVSPVTGEPINDYLRPASGGRPAVLAGQLFAAYATLFATDAVANR